MCILILGQGQTVAHMSYGSEPAILLLVQDPTQSLLAGIHMESLFTLESPLVLY